MRMANALVHGELHVSAHLGDKRAHLYVGWVTRRRPNCELLSLTKERGEVSAFISGEAYPEQGAIRRPKESGHEVNADDISHLFHLHADDPLFPASLNGWFHGLLIDRTRESVTLFNDRYGMHRLYYHEAPDTFYFASEAKAILAVRPELRRIDDRSLGEFVSCGAVLEDRTLFQGIHALPPASSWTFCNGRLEEKRSYFQPKEWEEQEPLDGEAFYQELRSGFVRNLPRYFAGDRQIGMSLTGGLDTRMILANWKAEPGSLPCYTFGSMFHENQDVRVARRVAETIGQPFQVLTAGSTFLARFQDYAERSVFLTDGCADVSRAPDLYLNELAREIAPVRMTGLYGGEILRGVRSFKPALPTAGLFNSGLLAQVSLAERTYAEVTCCHPISFAAFRQGPWHLRGSLALEQTRLSMRTPFLDNDFVRTVFRAPASSLSGNDISFRLIADGNRDLMKIPTDRGVTAKHGLTAAKLAHISHELSFKAEYAFDMGMPQWLARLDHTFAPLHLERAFLGRHKPFHFRIWYRDALAAYVKEMLLDERSLSRPHVDRKGVEKVVRMHLKGYGNYTNDIHKLLTIELVYRLFMDERAQRDCEAPPVTETCLLDSRGD